MRTSTWIISPSVSKKCLKPPSSHIEAHIGIIPPLIGNPCFMGIYIYMGVDQNKRAWERINRESIADPQVAIAEGFCSFQCHLYRKWNRYFYIHRDVYKSQPWRNWQETWYGHGPVTTFGGSSIASQSRICRSQTWKLGLQKDWHCKCCVCLGK